MRTRRGRKTCEVMNPAAPCVERWRIDVALRAVRAGAGLQACPHQRPPHLARRRQDDLRRPDLGGLGQRADRRPARHARRRAVGGARMGPLGDAGGQHPPRVGPGGARGRPRPGRGRSHGPGPRHADGRQGDRPCDGGARRGGRERRSIPPRLWSRRRTPPRKRPRNSARLKHRPRSSRRATPSNRWIMISDNRS